MSYKTGIINHLINNKIEIHFTDPSNIPTITEDNIVSESMKLKQSICDSDELRFGGCIASQFTIDLINTTERQFSSKLTGKWIAVKITQTYADPNISVYPSSSLHPSNGVYPGRKVADKEFWIFSGYIDSAKASKTDKNVITITAYDALAKLYEIDATNALYDKFKKSETTNNYSDDDYFDFGGIWNFCLQQNGAINISHPHSFSVIYQSNPNKQDTYHLINTAWCESKSKITFGKLLKDACEMVAAFGVIKPNSEKGTFDLVKLSGNVETYEFYEKLETEEYISTGYTDFVFSVYDGNTEKPGKTVTAGGLANYPDTNVSKCYDFSDNALIWVPYNYSSGQGRTQTNFDTFINGNNGSGHLIGHRLAMYSESGECAYDYYTSLTATLDGRLWVSVGTPITILVNKTNPDGSFVLDDETGDIIKDEVNTYVLSRTLTGIQALTDNIEVKGAP